MGVVWLAESRGPGGFVKRCVVKELLPELARDERHRAMFLDEARLAARLVHRNIVQTNEVGEDGDRLFMALELLEGCTLRRAWELTPRHALPPPVAARIVAEVLAGLHTAHEARDDDGHLLSVVHRDVTPGNVFVCFDGQVKLIDFGVAKTREAERKDRTREGFVKGSIAYMSPDHVQNAPIDRRADVFSAGLLLRELLTGERIWGAADESAIVRRLVVGEIPPFPAASGAPKVLRAICERAMSPAREDRFATALAMRDALEASGELGTSADIARMFDGALDQERVRVRMTMKRANVEPEPDVVELPSSELVTVEVKVPEKRRVAPRDVFVAAIALVASLAAALSIAAFASVSSTTAQNGAKPVETITVQVKPAPTPPPPPPVRIADAIDEPPADAQQ